MGFRCPNCKQDFGTDKAKFDQHMKEEGFVSDMASLTMTNLSDIIKGSNTFGLGNKTEK